MRRMFGKPVERRVELPEDRVELKPILGIRPGAWLAALYASAIVIALLAVLILPGIMKPGSVVAFDSEPRGAAVYVDGLYSGSTPCSVFISPGERELRFSAPSFVPRSTRERIGSRLLASAFLPARKAVFAELKAEAPTLALASGGADFARWSFAGEPSATYQIPPVLSEAAYRAGPYAGSGENRVGMEGVLEASARFAATQAAMRDLARALSLVESAGLAPSPLGALNAASAAVRYLDRTDGSALWLASVLSKDAASLVASSRLYEAENERAASPSSRPSAVATGFASLRRITVGSLVFREIPAGVLVPRESLPRSLQIPSYWIAETEVPQDVWDSFVKANPLWSTGRKAELIAEGLATDSYGTRSTDPAFPSQSASGVSWHAASAFCDWLQASLPPALSSARVRLPGEAEWERAAAFPGSGMEGGLWEWCDDPFAPVDFLPAPAVAIAAVSSPERSVRGGSWANAAHPVAAGTRASLPPETCSEFVGFRPVIAIAIAIGEGSGR